MSSWGWKSRWTAARRDYGPRWLRSMSVAVPWVTVGLLFMMIVFMRGVFMSAEGALFVLPDAEVSDVAFASNVALMMPTSQGTLVFFDDTRYVLEDEGQMKLFAGALAERFSSGEERTLLVLADMRVRHADLLRLAGITKRSGCQRILFAEKRAGTGER